MLAKTGAAIGQPDRELRWHNGQLTGKVVGALHTTYDVAYGSLVEVSAGGQPNDGPAGGLTDGASITLYTRAPDANLRSSFGVSHRPDLAAGSRERINFNIGGTTDYNLMDDLKRSSFVQSTPYTNTGKFKIFGPYIGSNVTGPIAPGAEGAWTFAYPDFTVPAGSNIFALGQLFEGTWSHRLIWRAEPTTTNCRFVFMNALETAGINAVPSIAFIMLTDNWN